MESKQAVVGAEIRIKDFLASNLLVQLSCFLVMCPVLLSLCLLYHSAWFYKYHKCEEDMFPFFLSPAWWLDSSPGRGERKVWMQREDSDT